MSSALQCWSIIFWLIHHCGTINHLNLNHQQLKIFQKYLQPVSNFSFGDSQNISNQSANKSRGCVKAVFFQKIINFSHVLKTFLKLSCFYDAEHTNISLVLKLFFSNVPWLKNVFLSILDILVVFRCASISCFQVESE